MQVLWLGEALAWIYSLPPAPYAQFLIALLVSFAAAKAASSVVGAAVDRGLRGILPLTVVRLSAVVQRAVFRTVVFVGLLAANTLLAPTAAVAGWVSGAGRTMLVLTWAVAGIQGGKALLQGLSQSPRGPVWVVPTTVPLVNNLLRVSVVLVATYLVLVAWDVNVTGLAASAGILGIALSFAAQDTLGNLFAGAAIMIDQPYRVGDFIVLDSGERGRVTYVGLRSTRLLTRDDEEVSIPNGVIGRAKIINESGGPDAHYRIRVKIGVAYGSDIDRVMAVLLEVAAGHASVCRQPEPRVRLRTFADSSVEFELLAWITDPAARGLVLHELNCAVYRTFAREHITIPFPQRDLHLRDHRTHTEGA